MRYFIFIFLLLSINVEAKEFNLHPQDNPDKIKKICQVAHGGDIIYLGNGVYTKDFPTIKCKGNQNKPLTITAKKEASVTIRSSWKIHGNYLLISHLNFRGYSDSLNYDDVIKQWWKPTKKIRRIGMLITGHHITLKDNTIGYFTASGIKFTGKSDYISVNHNVIYNNAWWSTGGTGGLIVKNIHQIDYKKTTKVEIINNLFFGNESRIFSHVFQKGFSKLTIDEGESFLLQQKDDANKKGAKSGYYMGRYLVQNNLILYNGKGTSLNKVQRVDFIQNYLYCNGTTAKSIKAGGIRGKNTSYDTFIANYVSSCGNKLAISIIGKLNTFEKNMVTSKIQPPMQGVILVDSVFNDPKNLNFNADANQLLDSFQLMLKSHNIKVKPTGYIVDVKKQIQDIISLIPKKSDTIITYYEDRVEIKNINNKGLKEMGNKFILWF